MGSTAGCTPEMAARIVALLRESGPIIPNVSIAQTLNGLPAPPPLSKSEKAGQKHRGPREKARATVSPEEADAAIDLALRVRRACVLRYDSIANAEQTLGLEPGTIRDAARLENDLFCGQLEVLRNVAKLIEEKHA